MITFSLSNGVVLTARTSGTEPKLKYYAEYCARPEQSDWAGVERELDEVLLAFVEDILRPEENGLERRRKD